ncbi:unnamed protein product, partial [Callosobruchus maculatus]
PKVFCLIASSTAGLDKKESSSDCSNITRNTY